MIYEVTGTLFVDIGCDCPNCDGYDVHYNGEEVVMQVDADSPEQAKQKVLRKIDMEMEHDTALVSWEDESEVTTIPDEPPGTDQILLKLGATPLFPLDGYMKS